MTAVSWLAWRLAGRPTDPPAIVFLIGSVIGAFVGAFVGAAVMEMTRSPEVRSALRVGWGAFVGRLVATAAKSAIAVAIGAVALLSALG